MKTKQPLISIIIPCFNAKKYIKNCLNSILESNFSDYEIIIIDDNSTDGSKEYLKSLTPGVSEPTPGVSIKIIFNKENLGAAKSRNIGAKLAQGKYLLFLDADTEIQKNSLRIITKAFQNNKYFGAIQAKLLRGKTNKIDTAGHFLSPVGFPYEIGVGENEKKHNKKKLIFGARSAGMAVRKNVFEKIGGFDEDYFIYGEETDLSWRTWLAGYKIYYLPQAKVYHFQKSTLSQKTAYRIFYEGAKNNTGNVLKNAPFKILFWMLPLHLFGWLILSIKLALQSRFNLSSWIYKGLFWNLKNFSKTLEKRKKIIAYTKKDNQAAKIMFGKIGFKKLLAKGWQWFKNA